ncbi:MAG: sulfotransferase [Pseudomonadota bacterium]
MSSNMSEQPVFIFGAPRSGTSLLSRILNAHPQLCIPLESLLYSTFWPIRHSYGELNDDGNAERLLRHMLRWRPMLDWQPAVTFDDAIRHLDRRDFHGVFRAILMARAAQDSKPVWGEKSPWHAFYWREILDGFPSARVVHIVRDPRDICLSWKKARQGQRHVYPLAGRWAAYQDTMSDVRTGWPNDAFYEVRYEALIEQPESTCRGMCEFLGITYDTAMLAFHEHAARERYNTDVTNEANLARPVLATNAGKWADELGDDEIRWIEAVAGPHMDAYGYSRSLTDPQISGAELALIRYLTNPISRIAGMVQDTQGQREGLQKITFPLLARLKLL